MNCTAYVGNGNGMAGGGGGWMAMDVDGIGCEMI